MVHLCLRRKVKIEIQGRGWDSDLMIISYERAQRLISRGCKVFLASMIATIEHRRPELAEILITFDFTDVFLHEVPSLPLAREMKFAINLA